MAGLPSYQEATARPDWLRLVAPYVPFDDYHWLCRVSRPFWSVFAPLLWRNPLQSLRLSGKDPSDDLQCWFDFVFNRLGAVGSATRALVRVLDAREFAKDSYDFSSDQHERTLQQSFKRALMFLPQVNSILLDGHSELDPSFLVTARSSDGATCPLLLSIPFCPYQLPASFFKSPVLQSLVYLDISGVPGSVGPLLQPALLPDLRILKLRQREIDNATLAGLASLFGLRLWSLDLTSNKISDDIVHVLRQKCFSVKQLRTAAHFRVEGKLANLDKGTAQYGPFTRIEESEWSGKFAHPERYFVDAPIYLARPDQGPQEYHAFRSTGSYPPRSDTADDASAALAEAGMAAEDLRVSLGLSHIYLSNNNISAAGLVKLVRTTNGQIEKLSCDSMPLLPVSGQLSRIWPASAKLQGFLGGAHVFRPVYSSNLRVLRIHHSLITNIPTLELQGLSTLARLHLAEDAILSRVDEAFPQTFIPDMNPRLTSMTLTCVPRRSSGPLTERIIAFLRLLSLQERAIQDVSHAASSWRQPGMLKGLKHLRLEFEPDPMEDGFSASEDLDAEGLMHSGEQGFSFFGNEWSGSGGGKVEVTKASAEAGSEIRDNQNASAASDGNDFDKDTSLDSDRIEKDYVAHHDEWNGEKISLQVWVGRSQAASSMLGEYRRLIIEENVRDDVGPSTPAQVLAGAPVDSLIFQTAWAMAVMPRKLPAPSTKQLIGMTDVLDELKRYRLAGRAKYTELQRINEPRVTPLGEPHLFWTGKLEVAVEEPTSHGRPSHYWR